MVKVLPKKLYGGKNQNPNKQAKKHPHGKNKTMTTKTTT